MALTADKIIKLKELAVRGVDGERDSARQILKKHGVDWSVKEPVLNRIKEKVGIKIEHLYSIPIEKATDILLISVLLHVFKVKDRKVRINLNNIVFQSTETEHKQIMSFFNANSKSFQDEMVSYAFKNVNIK